MAKPIFHGQWCTMYTRCIANIFHYKFSRKSIFADMVLIAGRQNHSLTNRQSIRACKTDKLHVATVGAAAAGRHDDRATTTT